MQKQARGSSPAWPGLQAIRRPAIRETLGSYRRCQSSRVDMSQTTRRTIRITAVSAQDPAVFIGSSSEGKPYAEYLQAALEDYCEAAVWDQGAFGLSESGLTVLVSEAQRVDFAILVLTPDDLTMKRGKESPSARDVIFEAGLFAGALGPKRTFLAHAKDLELDLPTDLAGITTCAFRSKRNDSNIRAAINPAGLKIREAMGKLGCELYRGRPSSRARNAEP
jgi:predicted nucleotide-binding protein